MIRAHMREANAARKRRLFVFHDMSGQAA